MGKRFEIQSKFSPAGDQPQAIAQLVEGINDGLHSQTLLGVTGSGKTFTIANANHRLYLQPTVQLPEVDHQQVRILIESQIFFP